MTFSQTYIDYQLDVCRFFCFPVDNQLDAYRLRWFPLITKWAGAIRNDLRY
jgi:hypothetical protein